MENRGSQIWIILIVIAIIGGGAYWLGNSQSKNPTIDVKTNTTIKATGVLVGTFYDGKEGYSLSIPSGNSSTCIWTYIGGNAAIPGSETTYARSASEKHTIYSYDYYDWKVSCMDDFGNQYTGTFPDTE
ncbi:MAG: hypothetical protein MUD00_00915 [Candidatus Pacebacteria bacterium]|jgi:hypothetical protein|nr:hypothetical protein [Candidatus Paceibacterota bacterium]